MLCGLELCDQGSDSSFKWSLYNNCDLQLMFIFQQGKAVNLSFYTFSIRDNSIGSFRMKLCIKLSTFLNFCDHSYYEIKVPNGVNFIALM